MLNNSKFIYTIYIKAMPERVWDAIIKPELTRQYWKHENISNWKKGSQWQHVADDNERTIKLVGEIIEITPQKLLVLTWTNSSDITESSRVAIEITSHKDGTRLSLIHDHFKFGSKMLEAIKEGWPRVLSSMKSFLETGKPFITWES